MALLAVKPNMGHLEGAAGMGGLLKCILSLGGRVSPASVHLRSLNPHFVVTGADAVQFLTEPVGGLQGGRGTVLVGVSSFGFGGTNSHAAMQSAVIVGGCPVRSL